MRTLLTLLPIGLLLNTQGQLADPGFELFGAGWGHWCDWQFVPDVPPNGGVVSVLMPVVSGISPDCFVDDGLQPLIYQELPGVQIGDDLVIHFWSKALADDPNDAMWMSSTVILGWLTGPTTFEYDGFSNNYQTGGAPVTWGENVVSMTCGNIPFGSTPVLFLGGHGFATSPGVIYLDNVEVETIITSVAATEQPTVQLHPNPATDQLWVDLAQAPTSVEIIDALGRRLAPVSFGHQGRTLEVDVSRAVPGICTLVLHMPAGQRMLRFLKS